MKCLAVELNSKTFISSLVVPNLGVPTPHPSYDSESELSDHLIALVNELVVSQCPSFEQLEEPFDLLSLPVRNRLQFLLPHKATDGCERKNRFLLALEELKVVL